jgi:hypothetical protein
MFPVSLDLQSEFVAASQSGRCPVAFNSFKEEALVDTPLNANAATTKVPQKANKILFFIIYILNNS